jgi:biopolymer transport protein ExbB/TolQ
MAYNYFVTRVNSLVRNMESAANLVIEGLAEMGAGAERRTTTDQPAA